ncbi:MAG: DUF2516 family protein [Actinomycetota bacterium]|nr:DUF2516 family protein [Actinomycetota bacterium]
MPGPPGVTLLVIALGLVSLPIAAIIDAARRPTLQWTRVGLSRRIWILVIVAGTIFGVGIVGVVAALEYLTSVRPKLQMAGEMGSG